MNAARPSLCAAVLVLTTAGLLLATAETANAQRQPYLQLGTSTEMTVVWETGSSSPSRVCYGSGVGALTSEAGSGSGTSHTVRVAGLAPDTRYFYSVGAASCPPASAGDSQMFFRTAPMPGASRPFRFWLVGDSGTGGGGQARVRDAMLTHVGGALPDIYVHVGDMAYSDGLTDEFTNKFYTPYQDILRNTVVWPAIGNHEAHTSDSPTESGPYYDGYVLPRMGQAGGMPSGTEAYYSFDYGATHFISLDSADSDRDPGDAMINWLQADLAATDAEWLVAFWHHPPYTHGTHNSDTEGRLVDMRETATRILEDNGVDLVLGGHSHIYERSWLLHGAYDTPTTLAGHAIDMGDGRLDGDGPYNAVGDGAVYVTAGHGGTGTGLNWDEHPVMYISEPINGSCVVDINGGILTLSNIREDGVVSDEVTLVREEGLFVSQPTAGSTHTILSEVAVVWTSVGVTVAEVKIEYSLDGGGEFVSAIDRTENDGLFLWTSPGVLTDSAMIRVSAADDATVSGVSGEFTLTNRATVTAIPFGGEWEYSDQGEEPPADWNTISGDWPRGNGEFGYGEDDQATVLLDADPNITSNYFRTAITVNGAVSRASFQMRLDDGAVLWVNGEEAFRVNIDDVSHGAYASTASADNEMFAGEFDLAAVTFVEGENIIAATVKNSSAGSSDISFDLMLALDVEIEVPDPPVPTADGGANAPDGGALPGSDGGPQRVGPDGAVIPPGASPSTPREVLSGGCGCESTQRGTRGIVVLAMFALLFRGRRRRN